MRLPSNPVINTALQRQTGQPVLKMDALPLAAGTAWVLEFESAKSTWRQGVFVATDGELEVEGTRGDRFVLWADTAPPSVTITCRATRSGRLIIYNVWNSGRGIAEKESQRATSGMLREDLGDGAFRYRCQDVAPEPVFDRLTFRLRPRQLR